MRCLILTAVCLFGQTAAGASTVAAQRVPGRELLQFPLGTLDRAAALGSGIGDGLGNPATIVLPESDRARLGIGSLQTSDEQGVTIYLAGAALNLPRRFTAGLSVVRATVDDIYRTGTDPTAIGSQIEYNTTVYSASIARQNGGRVSTGVSVRYRTGEIDRANGAAIGVDGGVLIRHIPFADASVGVATFLWRPANGEDERTSLNVAGDLRLMGSERRGARAGYGLTITEGRERDHFGYAVGRYGRWEGIVGALYSETYGSSSWRNRLGVRLNYGEYLVGVARESQDAGFSATYQFTLAMTIRDR
jgi:hypothetical protein